MPVLGATLLSLLGAIVAFFSVLAMLDGPATEPRASSSTSRLEAFAAPGLATARATSLATLRPIPVAKAVAESPAAPIAGDDRPATVRANAVVAPLARRAPPQPVLASDEPTAPPAKASPATAPPPQPRLATRKPFASEARSALGGPLPAAAHSGTPFKAATPTRPRAAPATLQPSATP